jgi:exoribonuclease R
MYKFICHDNKYESYEYVETKTFQPIHGTIKEHPKHIKLFMNDVFDYHDDKFCLVHSNIRSNKMIPGILDLQITHGKEKQKFLYLCKPDDKRIPFFLIPYQKQLNFDKSIKKIYITFEYKHWDFERPYGKINQNLGSIDVLAHYYEYVLYCKTLNISIQKFTKETKQRLQNESEEMIVNKIVEKYNIPVRNKRDYYIFTVDNQQSNDYDDALSFHPDERKISIYISNVALIMDELELWKAFTNRVSTIYLPDKKRTMLPTILIDTLCSLKEKQYKLCYVLDVFYDEKGHIIKHEFSHCKAYIAKNISYNSVEDIERLQFSIQNMLSLLHLKNPKQLVTKMMLLFNHLTACKLREYKEGIFKSLHQESVKIETQVPQHVYEHICILKNNASQYCLYSENISYVSKNHKEIDIYAQATSPIRRLVDLLNNIVIMKHIMGIQMTSECDVFYNYWTDDTHLEEINIASRAIRKIQSKCAIYENYEKQGKQTTYKGYVFDKVYKTGDGKYQYMVYIDSLKLTTYVTLVEELENYSSHYFSLYVFMSEENDKKKIKLQLCYENKDLI